jgi:hypothetical protein
MNQSGALGPKPTNGLVALVGETIVILRQVWWSEKGTHVVMMRLRKEVILDRRYEHEFRQALSEMDRAVAIENADSGNR